MSEITAYLLTLFLVCALAIWLFVALWSWVARKLRKPIKAHRTENEQAPVTISISVNLDSKHDDSGPIIDVMNLRRNNRHIK